MSNISEDFAPLNAQEKQQIAVQQRKYYYVLVAYAAVAAEAFYLMSTQTQWPIFYKGIVGVLLSAAAALIVVQNHALNRDADAAKKRIVQGNIASITRNKNNFFISLNNEQMIVNQLLVQGIDLKAGAYIYVEMLPNSKKVLAVKLAEAPKVAEAVAPQNTEPVAKTTTIPLSDNAPHSYQEPFTLADREYLQKQKTLLRNQNLIAAVLWGALTFFGVMILVRFMADNSAAGRWTWAKELLPILGVSITLWFSYKQWNAKNKYWADALKANAKLVVTSPISDKTVSSREIEPHYTLQGHLSTYKNYLQIQGKNINVPEQIYAAVNTSELAQLHFLASDTDTPFLLILDFNGVKKGFFIEVLTVS
jgi:hypothetical protein